MGDEETIDEPVKDMGRLFQDFSQVHVVQIILIVIVAVLVIRVSQNLLPWLADRLPTRWRQPTLVLVPILRLIAIALGFILIVPRVVDPTFENLITLFGAVGLALGFAFKDYASSLIAGIVALYEMPYRPGDWIEVDGTYGEVANIGARTVDIVTPDDTVVFIPHLKLWTNLIHNANNGGPNLMCVAEFFLDARHDAATVKRILYDVALTSPFLQLQQPIVVIVTEKPWGTHYLLRTYPIERRDQFQFLTDLTVRGKDALRKGGFEFTRAGLVPEMN
ncbi:MAG: mechanosensitive ion channel domain-containing protein [Pirellulaceae bacterium]